MKRAFIWMKEGKTCVLEADRVEYDHDTAIVFIYKGTSVVGVFDMASISCAYVTEQKKGD